MIELHQIASGLMVRDKMDGTDWQVDGYWTCPVVRLINRQGEVKVLGIYGLTWANMEPVNVTMTVTQENQNG